MTRPQLPPGYIGTAKAVATPGVANVMGVVVDIFGGAYKAKGDSTFITFTIKDSNLDNGHIWDGLKVRYFMSTEALLPPIRERDVILLRGINMKMIDGKVIGSATQYRPIPWAIFRPDRDPASNLSALTGPEPFEPTLQEKAYASFLLEASPTAFRAATVVRPNFEQVQASKPSTISRKFSLLQDIGGKQYVDLVGEIVKIHGNDSEKATIYLTDYTENESLFPYADDKDDGYHGREGDEHGYLKPQKKNWNGPSGRRTIQITLWEPHASAVRGNFSTNELVRLKNVHLKRSRVEEGYVEGVIHQNRDKPDVANAYPVKSSDDLVKQLLSRKEEYWKAHPKKQKRKSDDEVEQPPKKSKTKKKQEKAQPKKESGQTLLSTSKRTSVNANVKSRVPAGVPSQSLEDIINNPSHNNPSPNGITYRLPFQNLCYHSTVRVVDFYPPLLEDFAVYQDRDSVAYDEKRDPAVSKTRFSWEWRFCLLVESTSSVTRGEQKERVKLFVSHHQAEHLLQISAEK
ncbi:hypothetical protein BDV18DRAFT_158871 [Aspergillus unguis]